MLTKYEELIAPARAKFAAKVTGFYQQSNPLYAAKFLIMQSSLGINMTKQVADWITRAGKACEEQGYSKLGKALLLHASHEEGHHEYYVNDLGAMIPIINSKLSQTFKYDCFLTPLPSEGVTQYVRLHEDTIRSRPYGQIAIEYEIEKVSVDYGMQFVTFLAGNLGKEIVECLSFVKEHATIDIGHTKYNQEVLNQFLTEFPETLSGLISCGSLALSSYAQYLQDCHDWAIYTPE